MHIHVYGTKNLAFEMENETNVHISKWNVEYVEDERHPSVCHIKHFRCKTSCLKWHLIAWMKCLYQLHNPFSNNH